MKAISIVLMVMCPALANGQMCITNTEPPQITNDPRICKRMGAKLLTRRSTVRSRPSKPIAENFDFSRWRPESNTNSRRRASRYSEWVRFSAEHYGIPAALIWAVMRVESNFVSTAVSHKGAMGLMQLMPETAKEMGVDNAFDPKQNILGATKLLRQLADRFDGNTVKVLAAYHAGSGAVRRAGGIPFTATHHYVEKVLSAYRAYQKSDPTKS